MIGQLGELIKLVFVELRKTGQTVVQHGDQQDMNLGKLLVHQGQMIEVQLKIPLL